MILGIQILGILFALFMFYLTFLYQRRNEFTAKESIFWFSAWMIFALLVIFPTFLEVFVSDVLHFSRMMDFYIVMGFMFIIGMMFHTYTIVRKTQNKIDKVVRKIAIEKQEKK